MSGSSTAGTAAPTPAASVRGDSDITASPWDNRVRSGEAAPAGTGGFNVPEGKVVVWDATLQQMVVKDRDEVNLKTWKTRIRDAAWRFWTHGPYGM